MSIKKYLLQIMGVWDLAKAGHISHSTALALETFLRNQMMEDIKNVNISLS